MEGFADCETLWSSNLRDLHEFISGKSRLEKSRTDFSSIL